MNGQPRPHIENSGSEHREIVVTSIEEHSYNVYIPVLKTTCLKNLPVVQHYPSLKVHPRRELRNRQICG